MTLGVHVIEGGKYSAISEILNEEGYKYQEINDDNIVGLQKDKSINQDIFFRMLGFNKVDSLDYFSEDNPTYIHDLNEPIISELHNQYDLVYDGGTMEHCFNIKEILSNIVKMLKAGGTIVHVVPLSGWIDHGFYQFSPTLFYDFYGANGFTKMKAIVQIQGWRSYCIDYDQSLIAALHMIKEPTLVFFIAEQQYKNDQIIQPIQSCYLKSKGLLKEGHNTNTDNSVKDIIRRKLQSLAKYKFLSIFYHSAQKIYHYILLIHLYRKMSRLN